MNNDRGMIKWLPFNSLVNNKEVLYSIVHEKERKEKPVLSPDEKRNIKFRVLTEDGLRKLGYKG